MGVIDLNADVGEDPAALADGREAQLVACVTSVNIACGGHAGDAMSMAALLALARAHGVVAGAHPSYRDPAGFGRRELDVDPDFLAADVSGQVRALALLAARAGVVLRHVKPHGALYNRAARDPDVARAIAAGLAPWRHELALVGLAGSRALDVWDDAGFATLGEAFADRVYEPDGSLRARRHADAVIADPALAAAQAVDIARDNRVRAANGSWVTVHARTLCIHGDTPNAVAIASAVREALVADGIAVRAWSRDEV